MSGAACSWSWDSSGPGVACAAVLVAPEKELERRVVVACALPAGEMMNSARLVRAKLLAVARGVADGLVADG